MAAKELFGATLNVRLLPSKYSSRFIMIDSLARRGTCGGKGRRAHSHCPRAAPTNAASSTINDTDGQQILLVDLYGIIIILKICSGTGRTKKARRSEL